MEVSDLGISDVYAELARLPERTAEAASAGAPRLGGCRKVCLCAAGEARIACLAAKNYADSASKVAVQIVDGPGLPGWIDADTLFVAADSTGDAKRPLSLLRKAGALGAGAVLIAPGGAMEREAEAHGEAFVKIARSSVAGAAFGPVYGAVLAVLAASGCCPAKDGLEAAMTPFRFYRDNILGEKRGNVQRAARAVAGCTPFVYAFEDIGACGALWAHMLTETPRTMSFSGFLPEFNHNEIVGWGSGDAVRKRLLHVVLYDEGASELSRALNDQSVAELRNLGVKTLVCRFGGANVIERTLKAALLGSLVAARLDTAEFRNANEQPDAEYSVQTDIAERRVTALLGTSRIRLPDIPCRRKTPNTSART